MDEESLSLLLSHVHDFLRYSIIMFKKKLRDSLSHSLCVCVCFGGKLSVPLGRILVYTLVINNSLFCFSLM